MLNFFDANIPTRLRAAGHALACLKLPQLSTLVFRPRGGLAFRLGGRSGLILGARRSQLAALSDSLTESHAFSLKRETAQLLAVLDAGQVPERLWIARDGADHAYVTPMRAWRSLYALVRSILVGGFFDPATLLTRSIVLWKIVRCAEIYLFELGPDMRQNEDHLRRFLIKQDAMIAAATAPVLLPQAAKSLQVSTRER